MKNYTSTREKLQGYDSKEAILQGISKEGGLFVPKEIPVIDFSLEEMKDWSYAKLAYEVMKLFYPDFTEEELTSCIAKAYDDKFDTELIAPITSTGKEHFLELFHGPTLAFKDMALSILPHLMLTSKKTVGNKEEIVILTATSGDTGKAALEGFADVKGTRIVVFFPEEGVSEVQKRQMVTQEGENTKVVGIKGNFDDAQTGVKNLFSDPVLKNELKEKGFAFSSANSINIGRLIPQVVYYFYGYSQLMQKGKLESGQTLNVVVPTGNFGNILAAYYAKNMGLPLGKLICASNKNKVLFDFFETGTYNANRAFYLTKSPSMDILISSNLERLLYHICDEDTKQVTMLMDALKAEGSYTITDSMKENLKDFYGGYADDTQTGEAIKALYEKEGYLMDTHTAVAYSVYKDYVQTTGDENVTMIVSTASPYKFTGSVMRALDSKYNEQKNDFELLKEMETLLKMPMPRGVKNLEIKPIKHKDVCEITQMKNKVLDFLEG